ncbi:hypothetical protein FRC04_001624 [Tulasnella sp. 424]|nr:hypothetical protein FRC04_001624 [Tulasnella sp. 424]KAG8968651.1 hypothetical protein FRC05_001457 [Tulasnella sp. 425]
MAELQARAEGSAEGGWDGSASTSAPGPTAQALSISELLSLIFSFSHSVALTTSARVCKGWSDAALDQLWEHLSSVFPLVELVLDIRLVKLVNNFVSLGGLNSDLAEADWTRFHSYAKRVRSLEFDETLRYRSDPDTPDLNFAVIAVLCLHHPFGPALLPRLRKLRWTTEGSAISMLPFLSSELKELYLEMSTVTVSTINEVFNATIGRTPNLAIFHLEATVSGVTIETALARWLQATPNLEEISLPRHYLTPSLVRVMGSLPRLETLDQSYKSLGHPGNQSKVVQHFPPDTFPSLINLGLNAMPSVAWRFLLASQEIGIRLSRIVLHAPDNVDTQDLLTFTSHVVENCSGMTELFLNLFNRSVSTAPDISPLPMALLESLYPCTKLKRLCIGHPFPFTFQQDDVERMGRAWPQMVNFEVCPDPDFGFPISDQMGSSLSILAAFAKSLPNLEVLALYINREEHLSLGDNLYPQWQFQKLTELDVGLSAVPSDRLRDVGFYIASLCRERPRVTYGEANWHSGLVPDDRDKIEVAWNEVHHIVGSAMEVKRAAQRRLREISTDAGVPV